MKESIAKRSLIECELMYNDDFAEWGIEDIAYIKQDMINDSPMWSIYGAEGTRIGYAENRDVALAIVSQHDLTAVSVH